MARPADLPGCVSVAHAPSTLPTRAPSRRARIILHVVGRGSWPRRLAGPTLAAILLSAPFSGSPSRVDARFAPAAAYALISTSGIVVGDIGNEESAVKPANGRLAFGAPAAANTVATISVDVANLRAGPGIGFGKVNRLKLGTVVSLIERSADWFRVQTSNGGTGWVAHEVIDVDAATASGIVVAKSTPAASLAKPAAKATILSAGLNLRTGPSLTHAVVGKAFRGASVDVIDQQASWYQIKTVLGTTGWVLGDFLQVPNSAAVVAAPAGAAAPVIVAPVAVAAAPAAVAPAAMSGLVNAGRTNMRQGPGTGFPAVGKLGARTSLTLVARHGEWYKVRTANGTNGWVSAELLNVAPAVAKSVSVTNDVPAAPKPVVANNRWVWPTRGVITSRFGWRWLRGRNFHNGVDIANRKWTPIVAARGGTVTQAGWCSGYGYCVMINHGDGFITEYGHMASAPPVRRGQVVSAGAVIGSMGMTYDRRGGGYATGMHLHFTLRRNGSAVNPLAYLR